MKAVVDVTIRIVVHDEGLGRMIGDSVDDFLERALHSNTDILTEGLVSAECIDTKTIHKWEE
jgi:hypothetical protein